MRRAREPDGVLGVAVDDEQTAVLTLTDARWVGPTTLRLAGWADDPGGAPLTATALQVVGPDGRLVAEAQVHAARDLDADTEPGDATRSRADDAFVAEVELGGLVERRVVPRATVRVLAAQTPGALRWTDRRPRSWARRLRTSTIDAERNLRLSWSDDEGLQVRVERVGSRLELAEETRGGLGVTVSGADLVGLVLVERDGGAEHRLRTVTCTRTGLTAEAFDSVQLVEDADLVAERSDGSRAPVCWPAGDGAAVAFAASVFRRPSGRVGVSTRAAARVEELAVRDDGLVLRGSLAGDVAELRIGLSSPRRSFPCVVSVDGDRFEALVPFAADEWCGTRPLPSDRFTVRGYGDEGDGEVALRLDDSVEREIPFTVDASGIRVRVAVTAGGRLLLETTPDLDADERGPFPQERLRRRYVSAPSAPARVAYFECYYGASATDSGRAIHDELVRRGTDLDLVWGVADRSVPVPPGGRGVVRGSQEWWEVLAHASFLTFNAGLPPALVRRPGQRVVQTWHGTPLKLLGGDRTAVRGGTPEWDAWTRRSVARWDALLAPNPYSAEIFPRAWAYEGEVLQLGYPRNDALVRPDPAASARLRRRLAIPSDHLVVLYAPTWRDGDRVMPALLDVEALVRAMGDRFTLLVRGHMNITGWESSVRGGAVRDVTSYPEINDLYLVADAVVTDYSSIMFDFSVTGKPMVFFVPDLDDYRDRRRGLYFDLEATAPGPVVRETTDVVEALRRLDTLGAAYARRYEAWVATYNPRDDGQAAVRAVDALFGGG